MSIRVAAIIPARMASSRLPGKPLLVIHGLPMVEHVRRRALLCGRFSEVVVATCDREIAQVIEQYGGRVVMTSPEHPAATDRVAEAARIVTGTHIVNVQGDEILVLPTDLERFIRAIEAEPGTPAWNAVAPVDDEAELSDPAVVKCAMSSSGRLLFCSRHFAHVPLAFKDRHAPIQKVLGILGYRREFLEAYGQLARTPLEQAERIDQSRILEHDVLLRGVEFSHGYPGINEPREVDAVKRYLEEDAVQQRLVKEIVDGWSVRASR